ncbi:MAG: protein kinase [Anaerolineaceae bacterium]|nr:protein kinase [Anaerolineaceae bacterium]
MSPLEVSFLGTFQVKLGDVPIANFRSVNTQGLFAYLILQAERPFPRDLLATLFWPDVPDSSAKKNLRQTLYQLRQLLNDSDDLARPFLLVDRANIQWNSASDYQLDVEAFLADLARGALQTAVGSPDGAYQGELLPGFTCDSLEFESWLRQERERLHRLALAALDDLTERQITQADFVVAQAAARRQLALEPWRESAHRQLMRVLALAGDRSAALAQFELCQQVLDEELGASPERETINLAAQIEGGMFGLDDASLIAGQYELGEPLGQGAMGTVYRGRDRVTGQPVAIKMLDRSRVAGNPELVERFRREAEALRQLAHPHIVQLLATDEKDGHHYLVMELVEGGDLLNFLQAQSRPQSRLPLPQVISIALDLSDALARAHRLNILHRDIKPANVLLDRNGRPKLTDFGIARLGQESTLTQHGAVLGSVAYLSPEACRGEPLDERSDIWAFGLLLYEMLAGERPFARPTSAATLMAILQEPIPDIRTVRHDLPPVLTDLLAQMLQKDKNHRLASVRQVGAVLEAILHDTLIEPAHVLSQPALYSTLVPTALPAVSQHPAAIPRAEARQAQLVLLNKVQQFWVEGVLRQTLNEGTLIEISLETMPAAVVNPWEGIVRQPQVPVPLTQPIEEVFTRNGRALLILGEPGSGKTVMLLKLASHLLAQARQDTHAPIPVVFNLASWAKKSQPLDRWLVDELNEKYLIPKAMGQAWVEANQLLLLLDGLDEVLSSKQAECVRAINNFRQTYGLIPVALCCRTQVYQAIELPVKLNGAVSLKPLTVDQTDSYLDGIGEQVTGLHGVIREDAMLQEIVRSPLMLQVMSRAFRQEDSSAALRAEMLEASDDKRKEALLGTIFYNYVQQMVRELAATSPFHWQQAHSWLVWLAQKMSEQGQSVFLLESLQPSWLSRRPYRWGYLIITRTLLGGFIGLILWVIGLAAPQIGVTAHSHSSLLISARLDINIVWVDLAASVGFNLFYGLLVAGIDILFFERRSQSGTGLQISRWDWPRKAGVGTAVALIVATQLWLFGEETQMFILQTTAEPFFFVLLSHFAFGQSYENDIGTVEALRWSWQASLRGVIPAIVIGSLFGLVIWRLMGTGVSLLQAIVLLGMPIALLVVLLFGLNNRYVETKARPNQGIWLSGKNALVWGGAIGLFLAIVTSSERLILQWWDVPMGGLFGVYAGIIAALISGLAFGGFNVINHFCLRLLLRYSDQIPRRFTLFLNQSARHVLLHRVGSGYIFIHQFLQAHLAAQER